jgi:hypothetical protein
MSAYIGDVVKNGLVLYLDAANSKSYVSGSSVWRDLSGNNNSGSLTNGPTFSSDGKGSIVFDGTNDYVNLGNILNFTSSFTVELYFNASAWNDEWVGLLTKGDTAWRIHRLAVDTPIKINFTVTGLSSVVNTASTINTNIWYHLVCVYNGTQLLIYLNGSLDATQNVTGTPSTNTKNLAVGWNADFSGRRFFNGKIPVVKIYNRALSPAEILENYNATKGRFDTPRAINSVQPRLVTNGLVMCLDAGNRESYVSGSSTIFDLSGNGYNGTLTNGPTFNSSNNGGIVFDGTNDYISCGNLSTLNNMSISMWVKVLSNAGNYKAFAGASGAGIDYNSGFNIDMQSSSQTSFNRCSIEGGFLAAGGGTNFMTTSVPFGDWANICFSISATYIQFYLNGSAQFGTARLNNASSTIGMNNLVVGARPYNLPNTSVNANIASTAIYNRAVTAEEVRQNYNALKGRFGL